MFGESALVDTPNKVFAVGVTATSKEEAIERLIELIKEAAMREFGK